MVRKQIYIEPEHEEILKRRSKELGISEAELIRRAIESVGGGAARVYSDKDAWQEEIDFMNERRKMPAGRVRTWTREDIYEERLSGISRRH
ncbi:MAG: hypothetical protein FJ319_12470 [SAR202 cluster bacterium]|nr:hypothetical protein [SAR202 cluster bacterium]